MYNPSAECQQKSKEENSPIPSAEIQQLYDSIDKASHWAFPACYSAVSLEIACLLTRIFTPLSTSMSKLFSLTSQIVP